MPKPYSGDLRARVMEEVAISASRREAAERYSKTPELQIPPVLGSGHRSSSFLQKIRGAILRRLWMRRVFRGAQCKD